MPRPPPLIGTIRKKSILSVGVRVTPHRTPHSSSNKRLGWKKKKQKLTPEEVGRLRQRQEQTILSDSSSSAPGYAADYDSLSSDSDVDSLSSDSEIEVIDMIHHGKLLRVHARPRSYLPASMPAIMPMTHAITITHTCIHAATCMIAMPI